MTNSGSHKFMPLAIDMCGVKCLVVGGGRIASRKALWLLSHGANVTIISPEICDNLREQVVSGKLDWIQGEYEKGLHAGYTLVIAATSNASVNRIVAQQAEMGGQLCCNTSSGDTTRVLFPAVLTAQKVCISIHSDGTDCRKSQAMRDSIARWIDENDS